MKVCFCGLGSIGKRHLLNLCRVCCERNIELEIHAFRQTDTALEERFTSLLSKQITEENKLDSDYDIVFVTNPTVLHFDTIKSMAVRTNNMFIEKPIFDTCERRAEELKFCGKGVYYVAGPLRYSPVIQKLKKIIANETVYCVRAICSSYLPNWRPNVDYRQVYSAKKELGGGAAIDLIHEWDYITCLFGFPQKVYSICGKYSRLQIDSEDLALYIAEYADKAVEIHLDYFGRVARREIEIFTQNGTIRGDLIKNCVSFTDSREPICFTEEGNDVYLREMNFFIDKILSGQSYSNIDRCIKVLNIAQGKDII